MKLIYYFALILLVAACYSCRERNTLPDLTSTPAALQDNHSFYEILSKRGYDDLVDILYQEVVAQNPALKNLEAAIKSLHQAKTDSLSAFQEFDSKNEQYYAAAKAQAAKISDSALRQTIDTLINQSFEQYRSRRLTHEQVIGNIDKKTDQLEALRTVGKIKTTLPLIEKFQQQKMPPVSALQGYLHKLDSVLTVAKQVIELTKE